MSETFDYDVFISHSSKDKAAVRDLVTRLKADGLRVTSGLRVKNRLERSRTLIPVMSANVSDSEWAIFESQALFFNDPTNQQRRLIPLRLDDTEPQLTLKQFAYVDWRHKSPDQYAALLSSCRPPAATMESSAEHKDELQPSRILNGHSGAVFNVAVTPDGRLAVSGSSDTTVRVWDVEAGRCIAKLEGHSNKVLGVAMTADGRLAVSGSYDGTVRVWELPSMEGKSVEGAEVTRYTNAKVLLVGDSGVGKSGLAVRLTEDKFEATVSTDAVWATQLKLPGEVSTEEIEREIWLWDFAGQADYRLIHQLFMDETALAVLVFNPRSENPFEGLGQWDRDLQRAARRRFRKLLVAGRCDRGGLMVSGGSVEQFIRERGFDEYLETSAYAGTGCAELREAIVTNIPWDEIPWTSSPRIFKLLKEEIIRLKDEGKVLLRMGELKQQLEMRLPGEAFTLEHWTVSGAGRGVAVGVRRLRAAHSGARQRVRGGRD
ncbi:MAG TPA: TIR domain-containing protein [Pyrinomonadaceae bacterium]